MGAEYRRTFTGVILYTALANKFKKIEKQNEVATTNGHKQPILREIVSIRQKKQIKLEYKGLCPYSTVRHQNTPS